MADWREAGRSEGNQAGRPAGAKVCRRSDGWPLDRFAVIERAWDGDTVVCLGGGPGLAAQALERIGAAHERGAVRVIAVNDLYLVAPWADILYFADARWWQWHNEGLPKSWPWASFTAAEVRARFAAFAGQKVTIDGTGMMVPDPGVFMLHNYGREGLSEQPNGLHTGMNGGYQAINLALLAGAARVLLAGYDMRFPGGRSHSHNGHPARHPEANYSLYATKYSTMLPQLKRLGVEVINCTRDSAIEAFPRGELASLLQ